MTHDVLQAEFDSLASSSEPDILYQEGVLSHQLGQPERALEFLQLAAAHPITKAKALARQATILRHLERFKESFALALQAINIDVTLAEGWECAGALLIGNKKWSEAQQLLALAVNSISGNASLYAYYALALAKNGNPALAYEHVERALALQPDLPVAILARIEVYYEAGYYDLALRGAVLLQDKNIPETATFIFGSMAFITGDYLRGLKAMLPVINSGWRGDAVPEWDGEPTDKAIVIYGGQGYGDMLQFARYLTLLQKRGMTPLLYIPRNLTRLIHDSFPEFPIAIHPDDAAQDKVPMPPVTRTGMPDNIGLRCSFPKLATFGSTFDASGTAVPYLRTRPALSDVWRERLAHIPRPWIGIVWAPGTWFNSDPSRTISYDALRPLLSVAQSHLISLQLGPEAAKAVVDGIYDASPFIADFADSAALVDVLDLLITFDSAPAHLAGGLGKPVWTMLHFNADWRWLVSREDSIWYPTMRLFRQSQPQDWQDVVQSITIDITRLLAGDRAVLHPAQGPEPTPVRNPHAITLPVFAQ